MTATGWDVDVVLIDGVPVRVRLARPGDREALHALFDRVSDESIRLRFFSSRSPATEKFVLSLAEPAGPDRTTLVVESGSDLIAFAGYDRLPDTNEAEVAFLVDDAHQGLGLGMLLLEHLAAIARADGVERFTAETLPVNRRMIGVFKDAGFTVTTQFEEGVVHVRFPIEPTETSTEAMYVRERRAEVASVRRLLEPLSIAVVGAGRRDDSIGHVVLRNLIDGGFEGPVYPVNPEASHVAGVTAYPTVGDVPGEVDVAVVAVPAAAVPGVVRDCGEKGVHGLVVVGRGFADAGPEGASAQRALVHLARQYGMRLVGPNSLGVVNTSPPVRMNATYAGVAPLAGRVGFISQSGALGIAVLQRTRELGIGISSFVSAGNKADISGNDLIQYWEDDPATSVIVLYLESFGNPRKFARIARRAARSIPIIAVKSARSPRGRLVASARTAAAPAPEVAVGALFRQAGVIQVDALEELFEVAPLLASQPLPQGRRVAIVANSGGASILAADACEAGGLQVPELDPGTQERLLELLPGTSSIGVRNPVDLTVAAAATDFEAALMTVLDDPGVDAVIVIVTPGLTTDPEAIGAALDHCLKATGKPLLGVFTAVTPPDSLRGQPPRLPLYDFPESAARALAHVADYAQWRRRPEGVVPDLDGLDVVDARRIVAAALEAAPDGKWLEPGTSLRILAAFGIRVGEASAGTTTAAGVVQDPAFGPLVTFGMGGPAAELLEDRSYRILPLTDTDARDLVQSLRTAPLLFGYMGTTPCDAAALEDVLLRLGRLAEMVPEIAEMEVNPLVAGPKGAVVGGARLRVAPWIPSPYRDTRRLR